MKSRRVWIAAAAGVSGVAGPAVGMVVYFLIDGLGRGSFGLLSQSARGYGNLLVASLVYFGLPAALCGGAVMIVLLRSVHKGIPMERLGGAGVRWGALFGALFGVLGHLFTVATSSLVMVRQGSGSWIDAIRTMLINSFPFMLILAFFGILVGMFFGWLFARALRRWG